MKLSIERMLNEYARLRKEAFRLKKAIDEVSVLRSEMRAYLKQEAEPLEEKYAAGTRKSNLIVATIMDEFSSDNWSPEFCQVMLSFENWEREVDFFRPDFLFVESAWEGNYSQWAYALEAPRVHSNARMLDQLIERCRERGIPTVFWNKEDPLHFEKFIGAAQLFDVVFTTDENSVANYKNHLGHTNVFALPFAAQPFLCNPVLQTGERDSRGFFAGSYYVADHGTRTTQMDMLFDALLDQGGVIYDRSYYSNSADVKMPQKYRAICRPSVPFDEIVNVYKRHACAMNVNSVTDSSTMMSRRVFEVLACARPVISTPSKAIENLLAGVVDVVNSSAEVAKRLELYASDEDAAARKGHLGYRQVMREHTYRHRIEQVLEAIERSVPGATLIHQLRPHIDQMKVLVFLHSNDDTRTIEVLRSLENQTHKNIELIISVGPNLTLDEDAVAREISCDVRIFERSDDEVQDELFLGALELAQGDCVVRLNDAYSYGQQLIADLLLPLLYSEADIVVKASQFAFCKEANETWLSRPNQAHRYVSEIEDGPVLVTKRAIQLLCSGPNFGKSMAQFFENARKRGVKTYSSDPFNSTAIGCKPSGAFKRIGPGMQVDKINI